VVGGRSRWLGIRLIVEQPRYCAVDEWPVHLRAFYALLIIRRCHGDTVRPRVEELTLAWRDVVDQVRIIRKMAEFKVSLVAAASAAAWSMLPSWSKTLTTSLVSSELLHEMSMRAHSVWQQLRR
jgi:hypothetical protein